MLDLAEHYDAIYLKKQAKNKEENLASVVGYMPVICYI